MKSLSQCERQQASSTPMEWKDFFRVPSTAREQGSYNAPFPALLNLLSCRLSWQWQSQLFAASGDYSSSEIQGHFKHVRKPFPFTLQTQVNNLLRISRRVQNFREGKCRILVVNRTRVPHFPLTWI